MRQPREAGAVGGPRWTVRARSRRRVDLVLPARRASRSLLAAVLRRPVAARRERPLVDLRDWWASARAADLLGAGLLAVALGGVILAFATADPQVQVFSPAGPYYLGVAAVAAVLFALHNRRSAAPLVPHGAFARRPGLGRTAGQLLRRRGADRGSGGHPDLRADHRRRRLPDQGGAGAAGVPGRAAGRRTGGRRPHPAAAGRGGHRTRDGARRRRVRADGRAGAPTRWTSCRPRPCWR